MKSISNFFDSIPKNPKKYHLSSNKRTEQLYSKTPVILQTRSPPPCSIIASATGIPSSLCAHCISAVPNICIGGIVLKQKNSKFMRRVPPVLMDRIQPFKVHFVFRLVKSLLNVRNCILAVFARQMALL